MFHRGLINEVAEDLRRGIAPEEARARKLAAGWPAADVDDALFYAEFPERLAGAAPAEAPARSARRFPFFAATALAAGAVAGAFLVFFFFRQTVYNYAFFVPGTAAADPLPLEYGSAPAFSEPDFFNKTEQKLIASGASFIKADLAAMKLVVYQNGAPVVEVPIKAKGKEGSWWETPSGIYKVESKERNHFSSFGGVYMPWSLEFQGNFFIHGWPTYPGGAPVASSFSGGCIRLATGDAEKVYDAAAIGMPVLVFNRSFVSDGYAYSVKAPPIGAREYLAADLRSNFVFFSRGDKEKAPIASLTKLVTALVAAEYLNLDRDIVITPSMIVKTSRPRLYPGERVKIYALLLPLLLESSNEAAEALAQAVGRDRFIALMNEKAKALGMADTAFTDPSGAGDGNVSTAEDLFTLAKYLYYNRSFILKITAGDLSTSGYANASFRDIANFNDFAGDPAFVGGKVGETTAAGETGLYIFTLPAALGAARPVVTIVLGSSDRKGDAAALLDAAGRTYQ